MLESESEGDMQKKEYNKLAFGRLERWSKKNGKRATPCLFAKANKKLCMLAL